MNGYKPLSGVRIGVLASTVSAMLGTACVGSVAVAQDAALEEITVTGSRIVRRDFTANSPILTIDEEMFDNTMSIGIEHVLNQLPQFVPAVTQFVTQDVQQTATNTPGSSTLSLRGLGANRNLILLDGRRAMPVNASGAVDINTIPSAAIERVESITGGASSVYGADAMAGVVNFILKRDYEGVDFDVRYGATQRGDGAETRVSGVFGANFAAGEGNVLMGFEHSSRRKVEERDRAFYRRWRANPTHGGTEFFVTDTYFATDPFNAPSATAVADVFGVNPGDVGTGGNFYLNADGTVWRTQADGNFRYNGPWQQNDLTWRKIVADIPESDALNGQLVENQPFNRISLPMERNALFAVGRMSLTDNVSAFLQGNFTQSETRTLLQYSPALGGWGITIPYGDEIYAPSVDEDGNTLPAYLPGGVFGLDCPEMGGCTNAQAFPVTPELAAVLDSRADPNANWELGHNLTWMGPRRTDNRVMMYQLMGGFEGGFTNLDWTWEAYVSHGQTQVSSDFHGFGSVERWRWLVTQPNYGRGAFFVGNEAGGNFGGGTAACESGLPIMEQFIPTEDCMQTVGANLQNTAQMEQTVAEFNLQGRLVDVPAGEARFAVGTSYRENTYFFTPDILTSQQSFLDGGIGLFPANASAGEISASEAYGEMLLPLVRDLPGVRDFSLELGYRYSDHDPSGVMHTYKTLFDWTVADRFRLRGGYQRANRAPNIGELFLSRTQTLGFSGIGDLCAETNEFTMLSARPDNPNADQVRAICEFHMGPTGAAAFYDPDFDQPTGFGFAFANTTGNPLLDHETARTRTIGAVMDVTDRASLIVDLYDIRIDDMIAAQSVDMVYTQCFDPAVNPDFDPTTQACMLLVRDPVTGARQATDVTYSNDSALQTRGIDVQFDWGTNVGPGNLNVNFLTTYLLNMRTKVDPEADWVEWQGTSGPTGISGVQGGAYEYRTFTTVSYFQNDWNMALRWRHLPDRDDQSTVLDPASTIRSPGAYNIFDLSGGFRFQNDWHLRFGIDNLFDTTPPVTNASQFGTGNATDAGFYDVLGRRGYVGLTFNF